MAITAEQQADRVWIEGSKAWTLAPRIWANDPAEREAILRKFRMGSFIGLHEITNSSKVEAV